MALAVTALAVGVAGLHWSGDLWVGAAEATSARAPQPVPEVISNITAGEGDTGLSGVRDLGVFAVDAGLYVVAVASGGDAVLIINVTDPYHPQVISSVVDDGAAALGGASAVDIIRIGNGSYAVVASASDDSLQVINLTRPDDPVPVATITDNQTTALDGVVAVDTFQVGSGVYAAAVSPNDNGLQVINLTRPDDPVPLATITDNQTTALDGVVAVDTFQVGSGVYAAAVSPNDNGLQVINLTRPDDPVPLATITDNQTTALDGVVAVDTFQVGSGVYAAAVSPNDNGLQVINLTRPDDPAPVARVPDGGMDAALRGASAVDALMMNGSIYAAAVLPDDDGLQVINLTRPGDPAPVARVPDGGMDAALRDASAVDTFMMNGIIYAVVATADGIVVVDLADPASPVPVMTAQNNSTATLYGASALRTFQAAGHVYAAVTVPDEGGAIWMVSLGKVDSVPPTISSATYEPWVGLLTISFSEPLNHTATIYPDIAVAGPVHRDAMRIALLIAFLHPDIVVVGPGHLNTLDETAIRTTSNMTIKATLDAAQIEAVGSAPMLYMMEGAVRDVQDNPIEEVRGLSVDVLAADPPGTTPPGTTPPGTTPPGTTPPGTTPPGTTPPGTTPPTLFIPVTPQPAQDTTPPRLLSSYYNTGTGVLNIIFSEPLRSTVNYAGIILVGPSQNLTLGAVAVKNHTGSAINAILDGPQRTIVGDMPGLSIEAGAVSDQSGNRIPYTDGTITIIDGIPPEFASSSYNTGTGVLSITFSESLNGAAIRYDRMAVRDTGESSGGLALNAVASKTLDPSSTTITLTLSAAQRQTVNGMATPQLDIEAGAVADIAGNGISAAPDQDITVINTAPLSRRW